MVKNKQSLLGSQELRSSEELRSNDLSFQCFCLRSATAAGPLYQFLREFVRELVRLPLVVTSFSRNDRFIRETANA